MGAILPGIALAQDERQHDEDVINQAKAESEIVVTGTFIRGIAPAGAAPISTSSEDIQKTGATTVAQLLQTIPQLGSFGGLQQPLANSNEVSVNRPNLRALPGFNTTSGSTTLVLLNSHRLVGMGVTSTSPDPDVIPAGVIDRLEVVPDGGSAIYGSDAVAGVMNFISLKRFDGLKADASYGFADNYWSVDANVTAGKDWGSGSLFVSYAYAKMDDLLGKDRSYIKQYPSESGIGIGYTELRCDPGNIEALAGAYSPVGVYGTNGSGVSQCDGSDYGTIYPKSERHSVFAGLTQNLSDKLTVELTAYYTNRKTYVNNGPFRATEIIVPSFFKSTATALGIPAITSPYSPFNFNFSCLCFLPGSANSKDIVQQADFQFGDNYASHANIKLDTWGVTSDWSYDIDGNWRLRFTGNYGESTTSLISSAFNEKALQNAITAGLFNPYDVGSSNPAAVAIVSNYETYGRTRQDMANFRAILDGDLFQLPAGAAKLAVGVEYNREGFHAGLGQAVPGFEYTGADAQYLNGTLVAPADPGVSRFNVSRHVKSIFGEIVAPVISTDAGMELNLSVAGRYDDYSDVGDTFNPRIGATFKPIDWVSIHAAWGKSFNAPGLADAPQADNNTLYILSGSAASFFAPPTALVASGQYPAYTGGLIVATRGNAPGIQPQKATTWSAGMDITPPVIDGLRLGINYFNIRFNNQIGLAPFQNPAQLYANYGDLITVFPSQDVLDEALANATVIAQGSAPISASRVYAYLDARKRNFGTVKVDGLDFSANYQADAGFGSIFFGTQGTYLLNQKQSIVAGGPMIDIGSKNNSRLKARTMAGAQVGPVLGQVTWNYIQGFDLNPVVGYVEQSHVGAFSTFDLFFKVDVPGEGIAKDLAFTLNVNNLFDQAPPVYRGNNPVGGQSGVFPNSGLTIGRFFKIGVSKQF